MNHKKLFIKDNLGKIVPLCITDNTVAVICRETNVDGRYIFLSSLVGRVNIPKKFQCGEEFQSKEVLISISRLKILNYIYSEDNIIIEVIYVNQNQTVMYGTPLFLFKYIL